MFITCFQLLGALYFLSYLDMRLTIVLVFIMHGFGADKVMTALVSGEADIGFMGSESSITGRDAWRRCRRKARWHFRHDGKGGGLRVRSRASTGHHGTSGRSSGIPTCKAQSKDGLPLPALQQPRSIKAQGMACAVRGEPYPSAHFAHRGGLQTASRHQDRD